MTCRARRCASYWAATCGPCWTPGCDTIILGCTHYPFLKPILAQMLPADISLIDTGAAVARQTQRLLAERQLLADGPARPAQFWTSASPEHLRNILPLLWHNGGVVQSFNPVDRLKFS